MMYSSDKYEIEDLGYAVLITEIETGEDVLLQGDDAEDMRQQVEDFDNSINDDSPVTPEEAFDSYLSEYFL